MPENDKKSFYFSSIPIFLANTARAIFGYVVWELGKYGLKVVFNFLPGLFLWGMWNLIVPSYPVSWIVFWIGLTFIDVLLDNVIPRG